MPTYTYACKKCDHRMDVFHSMNDAPKVKCEECGSTRTKKLLGTGAGIIFKGSGFYETDYKGGGKKEEKSEAKTDGGETKSSSSETKSESKSSDKGESKSSSTSGSGSKKAD